MKSENYHHQYDGKEELHCMCGCKGKKRSHVKSGLSVLCGSCGIQLVNNHGEVL